MISAIGLLLLIVSAWHHITEFFAIESIAGPAIALSLDAGLACVLIYAGWWLDRTDLSSDSKWSVARWTALGSLGGGGLATVTLVAQVIEGRVPPEPIFVGLVATTGGAVLSFVAGYYSVNLRRTNQWYESVFNNTFQFTGLLRPDGTVLAANDTALSFGGFDRDEVVGHSFPEIPWWTHSEPVHERVQNAIDRAAGGEVVRYETEVKGADGLRTIDFSARPIDDDQGETSLIVVEGRDITPQIQQRQHLQVLQRIVRHNVRTDVMKLSTWAEQQATATDPDEREAYTEQIRAVLDSWTEMTDKMSRIQEQLDQSQHRTVAVKSVVTEAVDEQREVHPNATITMSLPEAKVGTVSTIVGGAVTEAIDNAASAVTTGEAIITVSVSDTDDDWVEVEISDTGPGLPEMEASTLETGKETPLSHGEGTGMWLIRTLVKEAGGDITVATTDVGTTLSFRLPKQKSKPIEPA